MHSGVEVEKRGKTLGPNCFRHRQHRRIDNELRNCIIVSGQPRRKNWTQLSSYKLGMREMVEAVKKTSFRKKKRNHQDLSVKLWARFTLLPKDDH